MRKATAALVMMMCGICFPHCAACMDWIDSNIYGDGLYLANDTHLASGVVVDGDGVYVMSSLLLENEANIRGDIYVCAGCDFSIRNAGTVAGKILGGDEARITQVVNNVHDMTRLDIDGDYVILADGVRDVLWTDLMVMGADAGTLILRDSSVILTNDLRGICDEFRTILNGEITITLPEGFSVAGNNLLIHNVEGNAGFVFNGASPGELHAYMSYIENDNLYISLVRETDYVKVLGTEQGRMLNLIRTMNPEDALLRRLDGAQTMSELHRIMLHSVAFNPGILGRPIRVLNKFMADSVITGDVVASPGVSGRPFYIGADDFNIYGGIADVSFAGSNEISGGLSLYGAIAESDDDINAFSSNVYGGGIFAKYINDVWMLRGMIGAAYADFDVPYIFDGGRIRNNAGAMSGYAVADAGVGIGAIMPYAGVGYFGERVLDIVDTEFAARIGIESNFVLDSEIGEYEYKVMAGINSAGAINAGILIGLLSPDDMIGTDVTVRVMHDEYGFATMLSMSAKLLF